jgi:hypothetical protein
MPSATDKRIKLEDWERFPLRTRGDVLRWRDRRGGKGGHSQEAQGLTDPGPEGSVEQSFAGDVEFDVHEVKRLEHGMSAQNLANMPTAQIPADGFETYQTPVQGRGFSPEERILGIGSQDSIPSVQGRGNSSVPTTASLSVGRGVGVLGLSKEFQDTFLW